MFEKLSLFIWVVLYIYFLVKMIKSRFRIWFIFLFFLSFPGYSKFWYQNSFGHYKSNTRVVYCMLKTIQDCEQAYVHMVKYSYSSSSLYWQNGCTLSGGGSQDISEYINDFSFISSFDVSDDNVPSNTCSALSNISLSLCDSHIEFFVGIPGFATVDLNLICSIDDIENFKLYPIPNLYRDIIFQFYGVNCDNFKFVYSNGQTAKIIYKLVKKDNMSEIIGWVISFSAGTISNSSDTSSGYQTVLIPEVYFLFVKDDYYDSVKHCITTDYYLIDMQSENIIGFLYCDFYVYNFTNQYLYEYNMILNGAEAFEVKFQNFDKCFDNDNSDSSSSSGSDSGSSDGSDPFSDNNDGSNSDSSSSSSSFVGQEQDYSFDEDALKGANDKVKEVFQQIKDAVGSHFEGLLQLSETLTQEKPIWELDFSAVGLSNQEFLPKEKFDEWIKTLRSLIKWVWSYVLLMSFMKRLTPGD